MLTNFVGEAVTVKWMRKRRSYILERMKDVRHDAYGVAAYWRGQLKHVDEQFTKAGVVVSSERIEDAQIVSTGS